MLELLTAELVWGLIPRFVGVIYLLAFGALIPQHEVMPGARRLAPLGLLRARIRRDFPGVRRYFEFPTLLWLSDGELTQRGLLWLGALCGAYAVYGGPYAFYALLLAWIVWLSIEPRGLIFPWDTMLQEVGFLVLFLPAGRALPSLLASALPLPSVAFVFRWFVLRLVLGFGKDKFVGTTKQDLLYLRGFFVWMPLPTPLGWYAHHAPAWFLRASLGFMFFAEIVAPVLGLFAGPLRVVAFVSLVALMAGIHATGNWGFFNVGYILLSVCLLDTKSSIFDLQLEPWASRLTTFPDLAIHLVMAGLFLVSLLYVFNNSWFMRTWLHWPADMFPLPHKWIPWVARFNAALEPLRWLAPFRVVNGYGVFPPHSMPPMRLLPVLEGSADGVTWKQYGYKHIPSFAHSRPPFIAPYHARLDQITYYMTMGIDSGSLFGSLFPLANPYTINSRVIMMDLLAQRLLAGDPHMLRQLGHNPFPDAPPTQVRVGMIGMTPTRPSELRATGEWWHVRRLGTLVPARGVTSWLHELLIPEPELFHPDLVRWRDRAAPLRAIVAAHASGQHVDQAVLAESDLTSADVECLWSELIPMLAEVRGDWTRIHEREDAIVARFGPVALYRLERVFERYVWLLRKRTGAHRFDLTQPSLPVQSNFRFHMLMHEIMLDGREAYAAVMAEPARVVEREQSSRDATQLWALTLFRYDQVMLHVSTFRSSQMGLQSKLHGLPSFFEYYDLLVEQVPRGEEFCPTFVMHDDGEHTIEGFYPPPPLLTSTREQEG
jgi:hypothetical protein